VLFLDIDGVLNGHYFDREAESSDIRPSCVAVLNRVLKVTGCSLVISSAWRYMILGRDLTVRGFEYLLRTHGVRCVGGVVGHTRADRGVGEYRERAEQIREWLADHPEVERWAVVDDMAEDCFPGMPFVRTDGKVGLEDKHGDALIELLGCAKCGEDVDPRSACG